MFLKYLALKDIHLETMIIYKVCILEKNLGFLCQN